MLAIPSALREPILSPSTDDEYELTVNEVQPLIDVQCCHENEGINDYIRKIQTFKAEHIVKRINVGIREIRQIWPDATGPELYVAFENCQESVDDMISSIQEEAFRRKVSEDTEKRLHPSEQTCTNENPKEEEEEAEAEDTKDGDFICRQEPKSDILRVRRRDHRREYRPHNTCDIPCPDDVDMDLWAGWSEARKTSYILGEKHPNAYYYRHLPKGEEQRNGGWSPEEKALFLKRMKEMRGDSDTFGRDWGLFSLAIPGRVGYQCSNFYRMLIETGELTDSSYVRGSDGKLHHISRIHDGKVITKQRKKNFNAEKKEQRASSNWEVWRPDQVKSFTLFLGSKNKAEQAQKATRFVVENQVEQNQPEGLSRYEMWALQNPLPDKTDFITGELIRVPAISPSGYVLDYKTWLESLNDKPIDPFTREHLNKRQLVILTTDNFNDYVDKIRNL